MAATDPSTSEAEPSRVLHPRLPLDLYERLAAYALRNDRSLNNAVVYLLRRALSAVDADDS